MNWQDYETLGHLDLKSKLVEYLDKRTLVLINMEQNTEYEYCEIKARTAELGELSKFIETLKKETTKK